MESKKNINLSYVKSKKRCDCQTLIDMMLSPDKENLVLAEGVVKGMIITKTNTTMLTCLYHFLNYDVYNLDSFVIPEEFEEIKEKINRYLKNAINLQ